MTLNGVMAVALPYFTDFDKPAFQHTTASISDGIYARVYSILLCVYDVVVKKVFTFAISSSGWFFIRFQLTEIGQYLQLYQTRSLSAKYTKNALRSGLGRKRIFGVFRDQETCLVAVNVVLSTGES